MIEIFVSFFVFSILSLFLFASFVWVSLMLISFGENKKEFEYSAKDAQVRVLTLNNQKVVQKTVDSIPEEIDDIHVIAEEPMEIEGANVHIVSDSFVCNVERKGRAIEWGRRNIECDKEFILYIDEDTIVGDLEGFSDTDIIQFSEKPIRSDGLIPYLSDVFRMGFQVEQRSFPSLRYPLYAWGGGFAVKKSLEDEITWDVCTVTEDTNFIWRAFNDSNISMSYQKVDFMNQAPPSIMEMIHQRRRWVSGSLMDLNLLPIRYKILVFLRLFAWGTLPLAPLLYVPFIFEFEIYYYNLYLIGIVIQTFFAFLWILIGIRHCDESIPKFLILLLTIPFVSIVHSLGASWALVKRSEDFRPTKKVPPEDAEEDYNQYFE